MRVLAARFPDRRRASTVLQRLQRSLHIQAGDADIAPLGTTGRGGGDDQTLLAGRFAEDRLPEVTRLVHEEGGEIVADVDETWTVPRRSAPTDYGNRRNGYRPH